MTEELKRKTCCVSMICVSLTNVPQVGCTERWRTGVPPRLGSLFSSLPSQAPDCLPCSLHDVVSAVLSLLRLCSGDSSSSLPVCAEVLRNVTGSGRVQKCALDALAALSSSSGKTRSTTSGRPNGKKLFKQPFWQVGLYSWRKTEMQLNWVNPVFIIESHHTPIFLLLLNQNIK